jgi:hypothetical protein
MVHTGSMHVVRMSEIETKDRQAQEMLHSKEKTKVSPQLVTSWVIGADSPSYFGSNKSRQCSSWAGRTVPQSISGQTPPLVSLHVP